MDNHLGTCGHLKLFIFDQLYITYILLHKYKTYILKPSLLSMHLLVVLLCARNHDAFICLLLGDNASHSSSSYFVWLSFLFCAMHSSSSERVQKCYGKVNFLQRQMYCNFRDFFCNYVWFGGIFVISRNLRYFFVTFTFFL